MLLSMSLGDTLFANTFMNQFNQVQKAAGNDYQFMWENQPVWNPTEQIQSWFTVRLLIDYHFD